MVSAERVPNKKATYDGHCKFRSVPRLGSIDHTIYSFPCKFQLHMWTAPSSQGVEQLFDRIACDHMSGLCVRSPMTAGQDGFRRAGSEQESDLRRPLQIPERPAPWIDRSHHLLIPLQVPASVQRGGISRAPRGWLKVRLRKSKQTASHRLCSCRRSSSSSRRYGRSCSPKPLRQVSAACA